jgi:hypothetical protein
VPGRHSGATTTLVRADAGRAEKYPELHPALKAQLRRLQLRTGNADPDVPMLLRLINSTTAPSSAAAQHRRVHAPDGG